MIMASLGATLRTGLLMLAFVCMAGLAVAQQSSTATPPDYDAWSTTALRAETTLENGRASSSALESLRAQIAAFRDAFLVAQQTNNLRIDTLRTQIDALGPKPEDGAAETADVATRRGDLSDQLERLLAPVRKAEEAYTRADGLIGEIDRIIRERQSDALLTIGPSPLNPANWGKAISRLGASSGAIGREAVAAWSSEAQREEFRNNIPLILFYLVVALALVLRGRVWMGRVVSFFFSHTGRGAELWATLASLGSILLPLIGISALTEAAFATGLIGLRGTFLLSNLVQWGAIILAARWLGDRIFNRDQELALFAMSGVKRAEARTYVTLLAILFVARDVLSEMGLFDRYEDTTLIVLNAPILVLGSLLLFRAGMILIAASRGETSQGDDAEPDLRGRIVRFAGRGAVLVGVVGPVLTLVGYFTAAERLIYPAISTLALFGLVLVLHNLVRMAYRYATRASDTESLIPVLANFTIVVAAMPPLALIWGARVADLTELWSRFRTGFAMGETRISPTDFLTFVVVFAIGYTVTRLAQGALRTSVLPRTKIDTGGQNAILSGMGYVGIFIAALLAITTAGIDLSSLAIVAGALSVGIGFGLQTIVSNFVSGIILLIERPIAEGDWIEVGSHMGIVKDISVRSTRIETFDRTDVIVPNADLISGSVINWTRGSQVGRVLVPIGVAYGTDTRRVEGILREIAENHPMVLLNPAPAVDFLGFGADAMDFRIRAIIRDINWLLTVKNDLNHEIAKRFQEENIEIPFAQRDVWLRNPETLTRAPVSDKTDPTHEVGQVAKPTEDDKEA